MRKFHPETVKEKRKATESLETPSKRIKTNDEGENVNGEDEENMESDEFKCAICDNQFKELKNLNKHIKNVHQEKNLKCKDCSYATNDAPSMQRHSESCKKRKREEDVVEQDVKRHNEDEEYPFHQAPNEDVVSDDTETCF